MAKSALIIGPSGSGKTRSTKNLDPKETFFINTQNKDLPYRSKEYKKIVLGSPPAKITDQQLEDSLKEKLEGVNMVSTDDSRVVLAIGDYISKYMPHIKIIVIDDWQYGASNEYMRRSHEKNYDKFVKIGKDMWSIANMPSQLREDLIIYFIIHDQEVADGEGIKSVKAKTIGKLIDNVVTLEGMFTTVLYTGVEINKDKKPNYYIYTENNGANTCKAPEEMFSESKIPNDLAIVTKAIRDYYYMNESQS